VVDYGKVLNLASGGDIRAGRGRPNGGS